MLKTKLNVLTLRKEPLPTVIFHEPEAIELCTTTPLMKTRAHTGCKVLGSKNLRNETTVELLHVYKRNRKSPVQPTWSLFWKPH
uniref:Uncharacterized protein n=1 Tax=Meleagris gallopavo TaxID=9103 RepID=A0A803YHU6_MELGA